MTRPVEDPLLRGVLDRDIGEEQASEVDRSSDQEEHDGQDQRELDHALPERPRAPDRRPSRVLGGGAPAQTGEDGGATQAHDASAIRGFEHAGTLVPCPCTVA